MTLWWPVRHLVSVSALLALVLRAESGQAQTSPAPSPNLAGAPPPLSKDAVVRVFSEEETRSRSATPNGYGVANSSSTVIGYLDLHPTDSAVSYSSDTINGSRWNTSGTYLYADLHGIPHGALLTQIDFYFVDNDPAASFQGFLGYYYAASNGSGTPFGGSTLVALSSRGTPGDGVLSETLNVTYSEALDVNSDGVPDTVHWWVAVGVPSADTKVKMIRVLWKRQVSPAPAVATFSDVPTDHPFFQVIEAMYAAGITAGCSASPPLYCPDVPVTRGQAAAFLSVALGLQWP